MFSTLSEENMHAKYIYYIYNRQNISMYIYHTRIVLKTEYEKNHSMYKLKMCNMHCTMYVVQCTMYNVQCTLCNIHQGEVTRVCVGANETHALTVFLRINYCLTFCFGFLSFFVGMNPQSLEDANWLLGLAPSSLGLQELASQVGSINYSLALMGRQPSLA